jgi:acyl-CoA thioesterase-2
MSPPRVFDRLYGGQLVAQSLLAASSTVDDDRAIHSAHTYFCRVGDPELPVLYRVHRVHSARRFSTRVVEASQGDRVLATCTVSFHVPSEGLEFPTHATSAPEPEARATRPDQMAAAFGDRLPANAGLAWPIDIRYIDQAPWSPALPPVATNRLWVRTDGLLGDELLLHQGALAFASDLTMFEPIMYAHDDVSWEQLIQGEGHWGASIDHAIWFHRPFRADGWLLHEHDLSAASSGRYFTSGRYFEREGDLVATVAQEIVIIVVDPARPDVVRSTAGSVR